MRAQPRIVNEIQARFERDRLRKASLRRQQLRTAVRAHVRGDHPLDLDDVGQALTWERDVVDAVNRRRERPTFDAAELLRDVA
jgi:hypothetical protein